MWDLKGTFSKAQGRAACLCHWSKPFSKLWVYSAAIKVWWHLRCICVPTSHVALACCSLGWLCQVHSPSCGQARSSSMKAVVLQPPFLRLDLPAFRFKVYLDMTAPAVLTLPTLCTVA